MIGGRGCWGGGHILIYYFQIRISGIQKSQVCFFLLFLHSKLNENSLALSITGDDFDFVHARQLCHRLLSEFHVVENKGPHIVAEPVGVKLALKCDAGTEYNTTALGRVQLTLDCDIVN